MAKEVNSLEEWENSLGTEQNVTDAEPDSTEESVQPEVEEVVEETTEEVVEEVESTELPLEQQLSIVSKLFGTEFKSQEEVVAFKTKLSNLESSQKHIELIPKLVEKIKSSQNILSYFNNDEKAYVATQLVKQEEYKGKEAVVNEVLKSNISELPSLKVIELAAKLESPAGIRNPFRQKLLTAGLDPDSISEGYDALSEDDKDRVDYLAAVGRKELSKLGKDIQIPQSTDVDVLAEIEAEMARSKEDLTTKKTSIAPISQAFISDFKELDVIDGFKFKVEMSAEDRKELEEFVTDAVISGEYDLSTPKGKVEMVEAVKDLIRINNWDKIIASVTKHVREEEQALHRQKSNNAQPIKKNEPVPQKQTSPTMSPQAAAAISMINEF